MNLKVEDELDETGVIFAEPKLLFKELATLYKEHEFLRCPAMQVFCRNTFVITAPMDVVLRVEKKHDGMYLSTTGTGWDQKFYDSFCGIRNDGTVRLPPAYVFYAKESLEMEVLSTFLLKSPSADSVMFIPAVYDIGKWVRPADFSFIPKDPTEPIIIKRGDPLFLVRFKTEERVVLERVEYTQDLAKTIASCVNVKARIKNLTLPVLYDMAKARLDLFFRKQ
jgi:hypothetical protein